jgi:predicted anti-sigma-YlaC factor YlaD
MAAIEMFRSDYEIDTSLRPTLRVVLLDPEAPQYRSGLLVANRRAARARMKKRRRRSAIAALVVGSLVLLAWPGHAFGGTNGVGLSTDLASSSTLSSGMVYVVQAGDTVNTIATLVDPVNPSFARRALIIELRSSVVVAGEHVLIP